MPDMIRTIMVEQKMMYEEQIAQLRAERDEARLASVRFMEKMADILMDEANAEIEQLRKERDEARRMVCEKEETLGCDERGVPRNGSARDHAKQRGWDCFKENS